MGRRRPIERLDAPAAAAAIERPLRSEKIGIDEDALADLVRESHGYPYFLQLWGAAVWRLAADGVPEAARRRVTRAEVAIAQATFDREKNDYYLDRYEELEKLRLLPVARTVAEAFEGQSLLDEEQLETAIRLGLDPACGPERTAEVKETFRDLGFVWRPEGRPTWEAGVPSLMDYMQEYVPVVRLH